MTASNYLGRRARFQDAIEWIAYEDEPTLMESEGIDGMENCISVLLVAHIWGVTPQMVAQEVVAFRRKLAISMETAR